MEDPAQVQPLKGFLGLKHLIGQNLGFVAQVKKIPRIAKHDVPVLITGETGTGKELIAKAIHYLSSRSGGPFIPVNCGAIPTDLTENELFGHEAGAFTGAGSKRAGVIAEADGGTLFLDEVNLLLPLAQSKLLRFLQEGEIRPLGGGKLGRSNVRVIAAMNADVDTTLREHSLREDLYYRLSVIQVELPPLRRRLDDIPLLAQHFATKWSAQFGLESREISPSALTKLMEHDWPGNVRELENTIERALLFSERRIIEGSEIEILKRFRHQASQHVEVGSSIGKKDLSDLITAHHGNISHVAIAVGKSRKTIQRLVHKYAIEIHQLSRKASS